MVRRSIVNHRFINWVRRLVREDASGQARYELLHLELVRTVHDIVIHQRIVTVKLDLVLHVLKQSANKGRQMDDMRGFVLFKNCFGLRAIAQVAVLGAEKDPRLVGSLVLGERHDVLEGHAHQAGTARDHDH